MNRRRFLTRTGAGAAALAVGGVAGATAVHGLDGRNGLARSEAQDYAGTDHGNERVWWSVATTDKVIGLTFDDGPHPELTPKVLKILADRRLHATFFMIGLNAIDHQQIASAVVSAGHEVANHTLSHGRLVEQEAHTVRREIAEGARSLHRVTGVETRWFRPPRGMISGDVLRGAKAIHQDVVLWSVTRGPSADSDTRGVGRHLVARLHPGAIVDLHDGTGRNPHDGRLLTRRRAELAALPGFLDQAIAAGYRFLTVSQLLDTAGGGSSPPR